MATLALSDVQTMLASLIAQYKALAAAPIHTYTVQQQQVQKHKLAELREEMVKLSQLEADLGGTGGGIALIQFNEAVSS